MADYIKREDALQAVIDCWEPWFGSKPAGDIVRCPYFAINKIPSADVQPVVHGEWKYQTMVHESGMKASGVKCSICGAIYNLSITLPGMMVEALNFCPNCGADMRSNAQVMPSKDGGT